MPHKKELAQEKQSFHPKNPHRSRYDFEALIAVHPELGPYVKPNPYGDASIDFFDPAAVLNLNKALLKQFYGVAHWDIPAGYLCPPIPGRADYIHQLAELLYLDLDHASPVRCIDIGVGANCIYPIIGHKAYAWQFVGTDIDPVALANAQQIVAQNLGLSEHIEFRLQPNKHQIFKGVWATEERFHLSICNPPFHASLEEAQAGTLRKLKNLKGKKVTAAKLNFGGQLHELCCEGGEPKFIGDMIVQSKAYAQNCLWFSCLVSKQDNLAAAYRLLHKQAAVEVKTIAMQHGNKSSHIIAWTFIEPAQRKAWQV